MPEVKRTLVKSGPELWAELTDPGALAGHLGPFGSVRITRTEPDSLVEWEGELASGKVHLEPSGFGTRVLLTAALPEPVPPTFWERLRRRQSPTAPWVDVEAVLTECLEALGSARHRPFSRA